MLIRNISLVHHNGEMVFHLCIAHGAPATTWNDVIHVVTKKRTGRARKIVSHALTTLSAGLRRPCCILRSSARDFHIGFDPDYEFN